MESKEEKMLGDYWADRGLGSILLYLATQEEAVGADLPGFGHTMLAAKLRLLATEWDNVRKFEDEYEEMQKRSNKKP